VYRFFIFCVSNLDYKKTDLNISDSKNRENIGKLARMVTNAIFLSHKLRNNVTIRIFVEEPVPHAYQIDSSTIRYLGPELRSLASLLLKGEKFVLDNFLTNIKSTNWFTPNPGLKLAQTANIFLDLQLNEENSILHISHTENNTDKKERISLKSLNKVIHKLFEKESFIFLLNIDANLGENRSYLANLKKKCISKKSIDSITYPTLVSLLNLILDDLEK
jgi:hypothetical protein